MPSWRWEIASPIHMGIMRSRYEGILGYPVTQIRSPNATARAVVNEGPAHRLTLHQVDQARIDFAAIENDLESIRGGSPSLRRELKSGASV